MINCYRSWIVSELTDHGKCFFIIDWGHSHGILMHQLGHFSFRFRFWKKCIYIKFLRKKNQMRIYLSYNPVAGLLANILFSTSIPLETLLFLVKCFFIVQERPGTCKNLGWHVCMMTICITLCALRMIYIKFLLAILIHNH